MRRVTLVLVSAMLCVSAFGASGDDAVRAYAESMAQAIIANREKTLVENFAPILRGTYKEGELLSPLKGIRNEFGAISAHELRTARAGKRMVGAQAVRTANFWYALATSKFPTGSFMKVEVTYANGRYFLAGYSVVRFGGNDLPPELRDPTN